MKIRLSNLMIRDIKKIGLVAYVEKYAFSIAEIELAGRALSLDASTVDEAKRLQKARLLKSIETICRVKEAKGDER